LLSIHPSISSQEDFNTHTWNKKKKLLMSLARLPWEPVANESLGFPLTFAEQAPASEECGRRPAPGMFSSNRVAVATPVTNPQPAPGLPAWPQERAARLHKAT
jgi:hypothetical protein